MQKRDLKIKSPFLPFWKQNGAFFTSIILKIQKVSINYDLWDQHLSFGKKVVYSTGEILLLKFYLHEQLGRILMTKYVYDVKSIVFTTFINDLKCHGLQLADFSTNFFSCFWRKKCKEKQTKGKKTLLPLCGKKNYVIHTFSTFFSQNNTIIREENGAKDYKRFFLKIVQYSHLKKTISRTILSKQIENTKEISNGL